MDPHAYCREKAATSRSNLRLAALFAPVEQRPALMALAAFEAELEHIVHGLREAEMARVRLAWWREEIGQAAAGAPRHPVMCALHATGVWPRLTLTRFHELLDAAESDLAGGVFEDTRELAAYCHGIGSAPAMLCAEIAGGSRAAIEAAHHLGQAAALARVLATLRVDQRFGRVRLPHRELTAFGIKQEELAAYPRSPAIERLVGEYLRRARDEIARFETSLPPTERATQRVNTVHAALVAADLMAVERDRPARADVTEAHPLRKLWAAWRAARQAV